MATERLPMQHLREILRQKLALGRSHREVARAVGVSPRSRTARQSTSSYVGPA
jgi:hypothetical protein